MGLSKSLLSEFDEIDWITLRICDYDQQLMAEFQEFNKTQKINAMAEEKKAFKKKVIRLYRNKKAASGSNQPTFNGYMELEQPLPAGHYKFGLWENDYKGEITYNTTKLEPYVPQAKEGSNGAQRMSNNQYKDNSPAPTGDDLPF